MFLGQLIVVAFCGRVAGRLRHGCIKPLCLRCADLCEALSAFQSSFVVALIRAGVHPLVGSVHRFQMLQQAWLFWPYVLQGGAHLRTTTFKKHEEV